MLKKVFINVVFFISFCWCTENNDTSIKIEERSFPHYFMKKIIPKIDNSEFLQNLEQRVYDNFFSFDISSSSSVPLVSEKCLASNKIFIESLKKFELWALKMYDSTAKIPFSLLNGNFKQSGDFDQCINAFDGYDTKEIGINSQYCLAEIEISVNSKHHYLNYLRSLIFSFEAYRSTFEDIYHILPKSSQIEWGFCIPLDCSHRDLEIILKDKLQNFLDPTEKEVEVKTQVKKRLCQTSKDLKFTFDRDIKIGIVFILSTIFIIFCSTIYDYFYGEQNGWITAFSLKKNMNTLISMEMSNDDISIIHGLKFFTAVFLIITHKTVELNYQNISNRNYYTANSFTSFSALIRASFLYTEIFLMISGILVAYSYYGRLERGNKINYMREIVSRYIRIMPPLIALMMFGTFVLPKMSSGPLYPLIINDQAELCKKNYWQNLLLIQNWFGFENICMTNSHHVATDFELFLFAPIIMTMLYKYPKKTMISVVLSSFLSTIARFYLVYFKGHSVFVLHNGRSISNLIEDGSKLYILPTNRFTSYSIGLLFGYFIRKHKNRTISKLKLYFIWFVVSFGFVLTFLLVIEMSHYTYKFSALNDALYASVGTITVCIFFGWMIYTAHLGYSKNFFMKFLEWKAFKVTTRIALSAYLVQYVVFHYNISTSRSTTHFGIFKCIGNLSEHFNILFAAIVMTLSYDLPFENVRKLIFPSKSKINLKSEANILDCKKTE